MDLCYTLGKRSRSTWNLLRRARTLCYQISEETITDLIILEAFSKLSSQIITKKFTKPVEAREGGDWEWWFTDSSKKWIGIRLQAKVIALQSGRYEHLHYKNKETSQYQCDVLIEKSLRGSYPVLPLYCLYSNWDYKQWANAGSTRISGRSAPIYGCSFVSPFVVLSLRRSRSNDVNALHRFMEPWHDLFCCGGRHESLPQRILSNYRGDGETTLYSRKMVRSLQNENGSSRPFLASTINAIEGLLPFEEPPSYVRQLLSGELQEPPDSEIERLTVFRARG